MNLTPKKLLLFSCAIFILTHFAMAEENFFPITGPCNLRFPEDHAPHPGCRTEWWYYTGNLLSPAGKAYGFQMTFFRRQITPPKAEKAWPDPPSAWRTQQLYILHAAISDISGKRYLHTEDISREAIGIAGSEQSADEIRLFLKNWECRIRPSEHLLAGGTDDFSLQLSLKPLKPPVLHGDSGYSQKGIRPESASCYYSFTRLATEGHLTIQGKKIPVRGSGWMDHEFLSAPFEPDIQGWDWFSLQLSDDTELMVFVLRKKQSDSNVAASGTFIFPDGNILNLPENTFEITVTDQWKSPKSGAVYPSEWQIRAEPVGLDVSVVSNLGNQEMRAMQSTGETYWEGSVSVNGTARGNAVTGKGYVELTGYYRAFGALN